MILLRNNIVVCAVAIESGYQIMSHIKTPLQPTPNFPWACKQAAPNRSRGPSKPCQIWVYLPHHEQIIPGPSGVGRGREECTQSPSSARARRHFLGWTGLRKWWEYSEKASIIEGKKRFLLNYFAFTWPIEVPTTPREENLWVCVCLVVGWVVWKGGRVAWGGRGCWVGRTVLL